MRILPLDAVLLAVLSTLASAPALANAAGTVAIAVDTDSLAAKVATEVQDGAVTHVLNGLTEVLSTLAATDVSLVPASDAKTRARIVDCESVECLQDLAQSAKVDLVIQVRVRPKGTTKRASRAQKADYLIAMVVARPTPDHEAWTEKTDCPACDAREIKHTASLLASAIAEHMKTKRSAPAPAEEATPTPLTVTPPPAPPPALDSRPLPAPPKPSASVPTYLSLTALAGGAALIGAGIYLIHLDGEGTCDTAAPQELCARRYRTRNAGIGLVTGGGLAALGGLVGLIFFSPSSGATPVALGFTGSSISVSGGF